MFTMGVDPDGQRGPDSGTVTAGWRGQDMEIARIEFFIFKRGLWRAYGPDECVVEARSLRELKVMLWTYTRKRFGAGTCPILMVGPRKPAQAARPPVLCESVGDAPVPSRPATGIA
jgi:hypothetical protein